MGPREGLPVALAPALWGLTTWQDFSARYGDGGDCQVWLGEEVLGVGCDEACGRVADECGLPARQCLDTCTRLPRANVDCLRDSGVCDIRACMR